MLDQTSDRRHHLLGDVPLGVDDEFAFLGEELIWAECLFREESLNFLVCVLFDADNVGNEIVDQLRITLTRLFLSQSDLNMR